MKHSLRVTIWLLVFFFISQIVGLLIVSSYVSVEEVEVIDPVTNEILLSNLNLFK